MITLYINIKLEQQLNKQKTQNFIEIILSYDLEIYQNKESKHLFHKYMTKVFLYENKIIIIKIRRYFRYKNGKKITYFLQQQFELFEKGTKFDSKFKDNIITLSAEGMSYGGIFKLYKGLISIGTIHNIIRTHSPHSLVIIDYKKMANLILSIWINTLKFI